MATFDAYRAGNAATGTPGYQPGKGKSAYSLDLVVDLKTFNGGTGLVAADRVNLMQVPTDTVVQNTGIEIQRVGSAAGTLGVFLDAAARGTAAVTTALGYTSYLGTGAAPTKTVQILNLQAATAGVDALVRIFADLVDVSDVFNPMRTATGMTQHL